MGSKQPNSPILIIDDEIESLDGCDFTLRSGGFNNIITCQDSRLAMSHFERQAIAVVLLDLFMPNLSGQELLSKIVTSFPQIPVIIITGMNEVETAVKCMKKGAFDYLVKPVESEHMIFSTQRAVKLQEERQEYQNFRKKIFKDNIEHPEAFADIVTSSKSMRSIFQYVETVAEAGKPVLITGESGVGKELVARAIHNISGLKGEFVSTNIAGLDDVLFSDTLFGHIKGAFTGAEQMRAGLFQRAQGGTLFLDEIGDLSITSQLKLLRVLQEREFYPVGTDVPIDVDVRIITATNIDLLQQIQEKKFRTDFYYRIQTHHIHIPPLRDRKSDIPILIDHFLEKYAASLNKTKPTPPLELYTLLAGYHFWGNIRELKSMIFDAVTNHRSKMLSMKLFKKHVEKHSPKRDNPAINTLNDSTNTPYSLIDPLPTLREAPSFLLTEALRRSHGNKDNASRILGITRSGLNKAIKRSKLRQ